jgi:hypothetical protein
MRRGAVVAAAASLSLGVIAAGAPVATAATTPVSSHVSIAELLDAPLVHLGTAARPLPGTKALGELSASRVMSLGIAFAPRDPEALEAYATAVNRPGSASFGHFITPTQFRNELGPTPAAIAEVTAVLRAEGFAVSPPSGNGLIMPVTARVAVVQKALRVTMRAYKLTGGTNGWAATTAPELPGSIANDVTAVLGLDNLVAPHNFMERSRRTHAVATTPARTTTPTAATPLASNGGPQACKGAAEGARGGGWTFNQLASTYGVEGLYDHGAHGQSETVDIFELEPFARSDISTFDTCYFGATGAAQMLHRLSVVAVNGGIPEGPGSGEASLDVEDISALAPQATINVYEAPSSYIGTQYATNDIYNAMVNADTANVISTSWGLCEPAFEIASPGAQEVENEIFEEAAAQGQSVFAAAGDSGSDDCALGSTPTSPPLAVDDPAGQPFVVGVGGTSLLSDARQPAERVWNDGPSGGGGGGGISATWPSPAWQADSGVPGIRNSYSRSASHAFCLPHGAAAGAAAFVPPCREVPDVTIDADENTGTSWYQADQGGWSTIGGTSTAAPMWAAITTDIASSNSCAELAVNAKNHHRDLGFVAPALYEAAATAGGADFNDITKGNNDTFGLGKGYPATAGYDMASGLGSPIVTSPGQSAGRAAIGTDTGLSASLCRLLTPAHTQPAVTGLSPAHGSASGGNTVVVSGRGFSGSGITVKAVDFGPTPASRFRVGANGTITATAPGAAPQPGAGSQTTRTPGPVDVTVTLDTASGDTTTRVSPTSSRYIYVAESSGSAVPSVSGVGPSGGTTSGGNTVDVWGSGFGPAGPVMSVTFGGVRASKVTDVSNYELQVRVPPETRATACTSGKGFDPANTCQVQVVVTGVNGRSRTSRILAPDTGRMVSNDEGIVVPRAGTELDPARSEYDYAPKPVITSIIPNPYTESTHADIRIKGTGFNVLTLDWVNLGVASKWVNNDAAFTTLAPDEITLRPFLPGAGSGTKSLPGGISVFGLGGLSNLEPFSYRR